MEFAELLPKTSLREEESELIFCSTEEGVRQIANMRPAGKLLFVTDNSALTAFRSYLPPRAFCLVLDTQECLPLFLSSDDVSLVVAAGEKSTLFSARFFAEIRKIPCAVFPVSAALDGAYENFGEVRLQNAVERVPLKTAMVFADRNLMKPACGRGYMRLLLARLALIEGRAMRGFGLRAEKKEAEERAYGALMSLAGKSLSLEEVVQKNAQIRLCERNGLERGEGVCLADELGQQGEEQAFLLLSALYQAFFSVAKPRLAVPDYAARAKRANASYAAQRIPTLQEFARRISAFEGMRANLYMELEGFLRHAVHFKNNFYLLSGRAMAEAKQVSPLKILPEKTAGLSSVMRDFGLMEWEEERF